MPIYKCFILNKEIAVNYEENQKDKLIEAIKAVNIKLKSYDNNDGKISDNKLLSFLAIKLQAEIFDIKKNQEDEINSEKKFNDAKTSNIELNDKIYKLREKNKVLIKENETINQELLIIQNQIDVITSLLKNTYEE